MSRDHNASRSPAGGVRQNDTPGGSRPADHPQFHVCPNASRPGLVLVAIGTAADPFNIWPDVAESLADDLIAAAAAARHAGGNT